VVKVLCRGGPYYWIKEPLTDFEKRMNAAERADDVRYRIERGWIKWPITEREMLALANEPVPPFSDEERARAHAEYPQNEELGPNEKFPWTEEEETEYWEERARNPVTHITFYGGAPHRPSSRSAAAAGASQDTSQSSQTATQSSRHQEP
jgi:hypothetical protein